MNAVLQHGLNLLMEGRASAARDRFRDAAEADPANPLCHHLLGLAHLESGDVNAGVASLRYSILLNAADATAHCNLANALRNSGRTDEALASYARAISLDPMLFDAYVNRAAVLESLRCWSEAEQDYLSALKLSPAAPAVNAMYGNFLFGRGRPREALARYDDAVSAYSGDWPDLWRVRGEALAALGLRDQAAFSFERAMRQGSDNIDTLVACGDRLLKIAREQGALDAFDMAIALEPQLAVPWSNRGNALCRLGRYDDALESLTRAIELEPERGAFWSNRGAALYDLGRYHEALEDIEVAMALSPELPGPRLTAAFCCLATGEFERGWRLNEARWEVSHEGRPPVGDGPPLWLGDEPLEGRTILLRSEQGLGDTIQFCRYVEAVKAKGARVLLQVQKPLLQLLRTLDGVDVLLGEGDPLPLADFQCFLMSLPLALGLAGPRADGIPYLAAEPDKTRTWLTRVGKAPGHRVGLVWSSARRDGHDMEWLHRRRNVPLRELGNFKGLNISFISLQRGEAAEFALKEAQASWDGPEIIDASPELADFSDTAALIEALDLVVSVDTAVAHLAGAMGKPVWLLNRYGSCWRWVGDSGSAPWYPTMKQYRQNRLDDWEDVLDCVRRDLAALTAP